MFIGFLSSKDKNDQSQDNIENKSHRRHLWAVLFSTFQTFSLDKKNAQPLIWPRYYSRPNAN